MDLIQLKIQKDNSTTKYINSIRKFDNSLSMGEIKRRIEDNDFVVEFDLEKYDVLEELNDVSGKQAFRALIDSLEKAGAQISIYQDGELSSLDFLNNWLDTLDEIDRQTEDDIDRELNG